MVDSGATSSEVVGDLLSTAPEVTMNPGESVTITAEFLTPYGDKRAVELALDNRTYVGDEVSADATVLGATGPTLHMLKLQTLAATARIDLTQRKVYVSQRPA